MSCAITAPQILAHLMERLAKLRHPLGQRMLRDASVDDIAIWGVLAVILADWDELAIVRPALLAIAVKVLPRLALPTDPAGNEAVLTRVIHDAMAALTAGTRKIRRQ